MSRARLRPTSLVVVATVVAITIALSWAAWAANRSSNYRLLGLQVRQTASVLQNQIPVISAQLLDAAQAAEDTGGDRAIFPTVRQREDQQGRTVRVPVPVAAVRREPAAGHHRGRGAGVPRPAGR